jgi:hypothetical protein
MQSAKSSTGNPVVWLYPILGTNPVSLPYLPDAPAHEFFREWISSELGYELKEDQISCTACVKGESGKLFDYPNRLLPLKEFVEENGTLFHIMPEGRWDYIGNASPKERGSNDVCPICHEEACDYRLTSCPHRGHKRCFAKYNQLPEEDWKCPLCSEPFSPGDLREFGLPSAPLRWE